MRQFIAILIFAIGLMPSIASAKRGPKPKVDPVDYQGVRYTAHVEGHRHCVQASDINSGKTLWGVTIYRTFIIPLLEEDVQWVFIKQMFIDDGKLIVIAEDGQAYSVDLQSHAVKRLKQVPAKPQPNKSLQPLELVGNERKESDRVVCGRKSRHGGTEDAGASESTEPYDTCAKRISTLPPAGRRSGFIEKPRVVLCCSSRVAEL